MLFVCDHYRYYELRDKIKSSAYLAASMIQQITNTRLDKQLTHNDMKRIVYASCFNFFHTNSMFSPYPFGIFYDVYLYYVRKTSDDQYYYQYIRTDTGHGGRIPMKDGMESGGTTATKTKAEIIELHPDLVCNKIGDEKLLIIPTYNATTYTRFTKQKLGLFLLEPKFRQFTQPSYGSFYYKLVITPKPGLFPVKWVN